MNWTRSLALGAATAVVLAAALPTAFAQTTGAGAWPSKQPIKLIVPFPPGGSVDQVTRILAQPLSLALGQTLIVENRAGASGSIGAALVANGPADGYSFVMVFDTHAVNPALIANMPFDTRRDLTPIAVIGTSPMVLATFAGSDYKSFADVATAAKAKKAVNYGSIGSGSLGHLAMALIGKSAGLDWLHVPYKGGGPLMSDAVAGHVPLSIASVFVTKPHLDSKRLRPLAVTTGKRSATLPDVPTLAESGFPGFEAPAWWALLAAGKTPPEITKRMNEELNKALKLPEVAQKLQAQGIEIMGGTPDGARDFIDKQIDIWAKVVKDNGIKPD